MFDESKKLQNDCKNLKEFIEIISRQYHSKLRAINDSEELRDKDSFKRISHFLNKAVNRSKEYENGSFIVLVVGPAKSGKSTLVNLIANEYVSPTHFLECTVRPSIISKSKDGIGTISVYNKSKSEGDVGKVEQMDFIIDCIRDIEEKNEKSLESYGISEELYDLSKDNIEKYVRLNLTSSAKLETILTSITTPGGNLMKENVFIVDMPGFDGAVANINDEVYQTIAQRADLIVFVQSSNAAMSKVSTDFLSVLKENNQGVPVCLIHNFFESSYWRSKEENDKELEDHLREAIGFIRKKGFSIKEEHCFSVNLGKVTDSRNPNYFNNNLLAEEAAKYYNVEQKLYERVIDGSDAMRYRVCLDRTNQQIQYLLETIDRELEEYEKRVKEYKEIKGEFDRLSNQVGTMKTKKRFVLNNELIMKAKNVVWDTVDGYIKDKHYPDREPMRPATAKSHLTECIRECEQSLSFYITNLSQLNDLVDDLYREYKGEVEKIHDLAMRLNCSTNNDLLNKILFSGIANIDLHAEDVRIINDRIWVTGRELTEYENRRVRNLIGERDGEPSNDGVTRMKDELAKLFEIINEDFQKIVDQYNQSVKTILQEIKTITLNNLIPDLSEFEAKVEIVKSLKESLN